MPSVSEQNQTSFSWRVVHNCTCSAHVPSIITVTVVNYKMAARTIFYFLSSYLSKVWRIKSSEILLNQLLGLSARRYILPFDWRVSYLEVRPACAFKSIQILTIFKTKRQQIFLPILL